MSHKKKKKRDAAKYSDIELNIMPFIDMFSILNVFLLFSAAFLSVGVIKVQVPFLSNSKDIPDKPKRSIELNVDVEKTKAEVRTVYSLPPINEQKWNFSVDEKGLADLHARLLQIRSENRDLDTAKIFSDDDVTYDTLIQVIDAVKILKPDDKISFENKADDDDRDEKVSGFLIPKIVMGSVLL